MNTSGNMNLFGEPVEETPKKNEKRKKAVPAKDDLPEKLGKAIRLPVPDFNDPDRKATCFEVDFPIAQINALASLEAKSGAAKKPIYQMSKWWARRQSSVFRSMLLSAAIEAPEDNSEAAKTVWEHYYCNHQKAGSFKNLKVLDCFMGGGTTLVEGTRLGMQMTGVDLNPVAWFVVKNELACSDPEQVKALFDHIEKEVKPQIQPFYTTTCPRGHKGRWIDIAKDERVDIDPINLAPEERKKFRWEGPEVIYTFWAKHGPCSAKGCGHRTPIFRSPIIAQKKLSSAYIDLSCPSCRNRFHAELGKTRMAPNSERIVLPDENVFTELSQRFACLLNEYDKGNSDDKLSRIILLTELVHGEKGLYCPNCHTFAGKGIESVLEKHGKAEKSSARKKSAFDIKRKSIQLWLIISPDWLEGTEAYQEGHELGGFPGASAEMTSKWYSARLAKLQLLEVRGANLPEHILTPSSVSVSTKKSSVPENAHFTCGHCGRKNKTLESIKQSGHIGAFAPFALQCFCPTCEMEGYNYGGRYFKAPDDAFVNKLRIVEHEWQDRKDKDLHAFWPKQEMLYAHMTHERNPLPDHGYTHWWKMFNSRQLLVHSQLLKAISDAPETDWALDVREQVLGAFQSYLRYQTMFSIYHPKNDQLTAFMANSNFNPKDLPVETGVFSTMGNGIWGACKAAVISGLDYATNSWETFIKESDNQKIQTGENIQLGAEIFCQSSSDLSCHKNPYDLVINDPPFGNNVFYADLSDYFYVWLRIALYKWYDGLGEQAYFEKERTPHSTEAIDNPAEHPDDRKDYEKEPYVTPRILPKVRDVFGVAEISCNEPNPLYRPKPSGEFYSQTLSACWAESGNLLKNSGIMAFTFHHSDDAAWVDILKALFEAGFFLVATYPIRSDETFAEGKFGSKKIEYDIIHVCRKRLKDPEPVSWARMRRWVKSEAQRLKELLEHTHAKELPESDLRVILRGKSLEFYSRHYGQVFTGDGQLLEVRDALLGINQLLDDLLEDTSQTGGLRPPDIAEPSSRLYLRLFHTRKEMPRDELHKTLRGTGISQGDLEAKGWIRAVGKMVHVVPVSERFDFFTAKGRNRKVIKTDLDQTHFLIGAAMPNSGIKIESELNNQNFVVKKAVDQILQWYAATTNDETTKLASKTASQIVEHWRNRRKEERPESQQLSLFEKLEEEAGI